MRDGHSLHSRQRAACYLWCPAPAMRWEITDGLDKKTWRTWHVVVSTIGMLCTSCACSSCLVEVQVYGSWRLEPCQTASGAPARLLCTLCICVCKSVISSPPSRESAVVLQDLGSDHHEEDVGKRFGVAVRIGRSWGWRRRRKLKEKEWKTQDGNKEPWE